MIATGVPERSLHPALGKVWAFVTTWDDRTATPMVSSLASPIHMDSRPIRTRLLGALNCAIAFGQSGSGDPFFPNEGDLRYNAVHYDVRLAYAPRSGALRARATIEAVPTEPLSEFSLDRRKQKGVAKDLRLA